MSSTGEFVDYVDHLNRNSAWKLEGACATLTPQEADILFFSAGRTTQTAKRMCSGCPVRETCRTEAERNGEFYGVWAGEAQGARRERLGLTFGDVEDGAA